MLAMSMAACSSGGSAIPTSSPMLAPLSSPQSPQDAVPAAQQPTMHYDNNRVIVTLPPLKNGLKPMWAQPCSTCGQPPPAPPPDPGSGAPGPITCIGTCSSCPQLVVPFPRYHSETPGSPCGGGGKGSCQTTDTCDQVVCVGTATSCTGAQCSGSQETIGDIIPAVGGGNAQVVDINSMWSGAVEDGWMMLGNDGNRYVQYNYSQQPTWNWAVSIGIASGGFGTSSYSGVMHWNGQLPPGTRLRPCETNPPGGAGHTLA